MQKSAVIETSKIILFCYNKNDYNNNKKKIKSHLF